MLYDIFLLGYIVSMENNVNIKIYIFNIYEGRCIIMHSVFDVQIQMLTNF